eukprot:366142-Chlamydomonas_euryale.AAC.4
MGAAPPPPVTLPLDPHPTPGPQTIVRSTRSRGLRLRPRSPVSKPHADAPTAGVCTRAARHVHTRCSVGVVHTRPSVSESLARSRLLFILKLSDDGSSPRSALDIGISDAGPCCPCCCPCGAPATGPCGRPPLPRPDDAAVASAMACACSAASASDALDGPMRCRDVGGCSASIEGPDGPSDGPAMLPPPAAAALLPAPNSPPLAARLDAHSRLTLPSKNGNWSDLNMSTPLNPPPGTPPPRAGPPLVMTWNAPDDAGLGAPPGAAGCCGINSPEPSELSPPPRPWPPGPPGPPPPGMPDSGGTAGSDGKKLVRPSGGGAANADLRCDDCCCAAAACAAAACAAAACCVCDSGGGMWPRAAAIASCCCCCAAAAAATACSPPPALSPPMYPFIIPPPPPPPKPMPDSGGRLSGGAAAMGGPAASGPSPGVQKMDQPGWLGWYHAATACCCSGAMLWLVAGSSWSSGTTMSVASGPARGRT